MPGRVTEGSLPVVAGFEGVDATERPTEPNLTLIFLLAAGGSSPLFRRPPMGVSFWLPRSGFFDGLLRRRTRYSSSSSSSRRRFSPDFAGASLGNGECGRLRLFRARASRTFSSSSSSFDSRFGGGSDIGGIVRDARRVGEF